MTCDWTTGDDIEKCCCLPCRDTAIVAVPATGTWMVSEGVVREIVELSWQDYDDGCTAYEIWVKRTDVTGGNSDG